MVKPCLQNRMGLSLLFKECNNQTHFNTALAIRMFPRFFFLMGVVMGRPHPCYSLNSPRSSRSELAVLVLAASWEEDGVAPKFRSARSMRKSLPPAVDAIAPVLMELASRDCVVVESEVEVVVVVDVVVGDVESVVAVSEGEGEGRGGEGRSDTRASPGLASKLYLCRLHP